MVDYYTYFCSSGSNICRSNFILWTNSTAEMFPQLEIFTVPTALFTFVHIAHTVISLSLIRSHVSNALASHPLATPHHQGMPRCGMDKVVNKLHCRKW